MAGASWQTDASRRIRTPDALPAYIQLTDKERAFFASDRTDARTGFGMAIPPHVLESLRVAAANNGGVLPLNDPLRRQAIPTIDERHELDYELIDPLGEDLYTVAPRVIHRYPDRVLVLVTDECALHCRHCFRRRFTGSSGGAITDGELAAAVSYVCEHVAVREVLLSGGDALLLSDARVGRVVTAFRQARADLVLRVATRAPVVIPNRVTDHLVATLAAAEPLWLVTQFNHPAEITAESIVAIKKVIDSGIPVVNQTVLLRGVNDVATTLADLFTQLVSHRVKPYYLFQGDLAPGTSHFRVSLSRGLELVRELRSRVSGLAMPTYAVDIPGGGGKVRLEESAIVRETADRYELLDAEGTVYSYPREES